MKALKQILTITILAFAPVAVLVASQGPILSKKSIEKVRLENSVQKWQKMEQEVRIILDQSNKMSQFEVRVD